MRIPSKEAKDFAKKPPLQPESSIEDIMQCTDQDIRKALEFYKSYFDQSELLILAIEVIERL